MVTQEYEPICLLNCDLLDTIKTSEPWSVLLFIILPVSRFPSFLRISRSDLFPPMPGLQSIYQDSSHLLLFSPLLHFSCKLGINFFFKTKYFKSFSSLPLSVVVADRSVNCGWLVTTRSWAPCFYRFVGLQPKSICAYVYRAATQLLVF